MACKPTVAAWKKIRVNATICRCSALEILLQKPLHLQFLTKFMALMPKKIINFAITANRSRRRA